MSTTEELCAKLEQVESELAAAQKAVADGAEALRMAEEEKEAARAKAEQLRRESEEAEQLRKEREAIGAKCQESKRENAHLRKEMEELRFGFAAQKKELEVEY